MSFINGKYFEPTEHFKNLRKEGQVSHLERVEKLEEVILKEIKSRLIHRRVFPRREILTRI